MRLSGSVSTEDLLKEYEDYLAAKSAPGPTPAPPTPPTGATAQTSPLERLAPSSDPNAPLTDPDTGQPASALSLLGRPDVRGQVGREAGEAAKTIGPIAGATAAGAALGGVPGAVGGAARAIAAGAGTVAGGYAGRAASEALGNTEQPRTTADNVRDFFVGSILSGAGEAVGAGMARVGGQIAGQNLPQKLQDKFLGIFGQGPERGLSLTSKAAEEMAPEIMNLAKASSSKFNTAAQLGEAAGPVVNTAGIKRAATTALENAEKTGIRNTLSEAEETYLRDIAALGPKITTNEARGIDLGLDILSKGRAVSSPELSTVSLANKTALGYAGRDNAAAAAMRHSMEFEDRASQYINGQLKSRYGITPAQMEITPAQIEDWVTRANTPKAVEIMRGQIGDHGAKEVLRVRVNDAFSKSFDKDTGAFNADKFKQATGLANPESGRYKAFRDMLRGSGMDIRDVVAKVDAMHGLIPNYAGTTGAAPRSGAPIGQVAGRAVGRAAGRMVVGGALGGLEGYRQGGGPAAAAGAVVGAVAQRAVAATGRTALALGHRVGFDRVLLAPGAAGGLGGAGAEKVSRF